MIDLNDEEAELKDYLDKVKYRLQMLDMIKEKLMQMKEHAQRVKDEDLSDEEIQKLNKQFENLKKQVRVLDSDNTHSSISNSPKDLH